MCIILNENLSCLIIFNGVISKDKLDHEIDIYI